MPVFTKTYAQVAATAEPSERAKFIRKTYAHLAGAILAFMGLEALLLPTPFASNFMKFALGTEFGWLAVLGGFMLVGWMGRGFAYNVSSQSMQYVGLAIYVVAEAIIFLPLLKYAQVIDATGGVIMDAAVLTLLLFAALTLIVMTTRKDFSFLGGILKIGGMVALGLIVFAVIGRFNLGVFFTGAMILFAGGAILYDTSRVLHHFDTHQHVAAALEIFASVALLFWYVLRLFLSRRR